MDAYCLLAAYNADYPAKRDKIYEKAELDRKSVV